MAVGRDSTTISIGAGSLYIAPIGTAEPTTLTGAFAVAWVNLGYTEKGTTFMRGITASDVDVAEEYYAVSTTITAYTAKVDFALAQMTAQNLNYAYNGGTIVTSTADTQFTPPAAGTETKVMLAWQSTSGDERYLWRQCLNTGAVTQSRQKSLPMALLPVSFNVEKPTGLQPWKWFGSLARTGV